MYPVLNSSSTQAENNLPFFYEKERLYPTLSNTQNRTIFTQETLDMINELNSIVDEMEGGKRPSAPSTPAPQAKTAIPQAVHLPAPVSRPVNVHIGDNVSQYGLYNSANNTTHQHNNTRAPVYYPSSRQGNSKSSSKGLHACIFVLGAAILSGGAYVAGGIYNTFKSSSNHLQRVKEIKDRFESQCKPRNLLEPDPFGNIHTHANKIHDIITATEKAMVNVKSNARTNGYLAITIIAGGALMALGGLFALLEVPIVGTGLLALGVVVVLVGAAGSLFKLGCRMLCKNENNKLYQTVHTKSQEIFETCDPHVKQTW